MIDISKFGGKVPIFTTVGSADVKLVDFPNRELFDNLFKRSGILSRNRYWDVLKCRAEGNSKAESGRRYGLTRERVRQIESKFIRLLSAHHFKQ